MLKRIEGDNANGVIELAAQKIGNDGFDVGPLDLGLPINAARSGEAIDYEVDGLIRAVGHGRWRPLTHLSNILTPANTSSLYSPVGSGQYDGAAFAAKRKPRRESRGP